jgi:ABC-2 type transport system permease protein
MTHQLRSELLKLRTTRTVAVLLLTAAALTLLGVCVEGLSRTAHALATEHAQRALFSAAGSSVVLFSCFVGLISVTSEFRYGTIHPTLIFEPRRRVVLGAKLLAAALTGILVAVVCIAVSFGSGRALLAGRNVEVSLTAAHTLGLVFGPIAASAAGAMLGVAIGTLIRNQVGAIVTVTAYAFAIDAVLFTAVPSAGRFLPGKAGDALSGLPTAHLLTPALGAAVLAAWTLAFSAVAIVRNDHSDA